ncbi:PREDICTED: monocarboxylate transporter 10 [Papilio xuthus]|uniref:Monocarboxylate transporter 10 n=2 Tax=Papilio xuthus TaxID=66420 RepID=A0AAJ6ZIW7_PAPXU|nr:PREDICTED: monocarboxylate transporter 10 [Papilio xuthus]
MEIEPKENTDLLGINKNNVLNIGTDTSPKRHEDLQGPPDGGFRAYLIVLGSFLTNGLLFGVINSYSVIYTVLQNRLENENVPNSESKASLVGALTMGTTFFLSPLSGLLTAFLGLRATALLGGSIATAGLLLSSFVVNEVNALYFTYGLMYGLGASLAYTPSLAILGHYFKKYLGLVNGIVTIGSSVFTVIMPSLLEYIIKYHGLEWMFRVLAFFTVGIMLCSLLFKPTPLMIIQTPSHKHESVKSLLKTIVTVQIWKNSKYRLWALSMPVALFGYFVPYVHIKKFIEETFTDVNDNLPLQCLAITSGLGRLTFGFLADKRGINRILLQQISFYVIGALTIILPFVKSFTLLVVISLGMGLFDGAFIALIGPIAFELCGATHAAQAIGCMLGLAAPPLSVGPPIAGYIRSITKSYKIPFVLAGISPLVGATVMFSVHYQRRNSSRPESNANGHTYSPPIDTETLPTSISSSNGKINHQTAL